MKQFNVSTLVSSLKDTLVSYLASSLPIGNHANQDYLGKRFFELWQNQTFKGPYLESLPTYQSSSSLEDLSRNEHPEFSRVFFDRLKPSYTWRDLERSFAPLRAARERLWGVNPEDVATERESTTLHRLWSQRLYSHQLEAFGKLTREKSNLIVATGTGSGKTECFL